MKLKTSNTVKIFKEKKVYYLADINLTLIFYIVNRLAINQLSSVIAKFVHVCLPPPAPFCKKKSK